MSKLTKLALCVGTALLVFIVLAGVASGAGAQVIAGCVLRSAMATALGWGPGYVLITTAPTRLRFGTGLRAHNDLTGLGQGMVILGALVLVASFTYSGYILYSLL